MSKTPFKGACMCGATTVEAAPAKASISACHCDMCRAWTSGPYLSFESAPGQSTATGPIKVLETSKWASRAICGECGSPIWYEMTAPGPYQGQRQVSAGLFAETRDMAIRLEVYIDKKPHGYAFEGAEGRHQMTEAQITAAFAPPEGENQ